MGVDVREKAVAVAVAGLRRRPKDPYWCRRLVEALPFCSEETKRAHAKRHLAAVGVVANHDPYLLISEGPLGVKIRFGLSGASFHNLATIEKSLRIKDPSVRAYVAAMLWLAGEPFRSPPPPPQEIYVRAVKWLEGVDEGMRDEGYWTMLSHCLVHTDYARLKAVAPEIIEHTKPASRHQPVLLLLKAAVDHEDWETFDTYQLEFNELKPGALITPSDGCAALNLVGVHALRTGQTERLANIMERLMEAAPFVQFLGSGETLRLASELADRGLHPDWVKRYRALATASGRTQHVQRVAARLG